MSLRPLMIAFAVALVWVFAGVGGGARADQPMIFAVKGAAINGYDPVAYFAQGAAVRGNPGHKVMWKGATWYFVSSRNRETFEANPRAYAPKYGGYCAYAVSRGYTASTDPTAWRIEDGRLFLNHSLRVREVWQSDMAANIKRANANWPAVLSK